MRAAPPFEMMGVRASTMSDRVRTAISHGTELLAVGFAFSFEHAQPVEQGIVRFCERDSCSLEELMPGDIVVLWP